MPQPFPRLVGISSHNSQLRAVKSMADGTCEHRAGVLTWGRAPTGECTWTEPEQEGCASWTGMGKAQAKTKRWERICTSGMLKKTKHWWLNQCIIQGHWLP